MWQHNKHHHKITDVNRHSAMLDIVTISLSPMKNLSLFALCWFSDQLIQMTRNMGNDRHVPEILVKIIRKSQREERKKNNRRSSIWINLQYNRCLKSQHQHSIRRWLMSVEQTVEVKHKTERERRDASQVNQIHLISSIPFCSIHVRAFSCN